MRPPRPWPRSLIQGFQRSLMLLLAGAAMNPLWADVEVLVHGGSRTILARSGDPLDGGGTLRPGMDGIFWFPTGPDKGHFFLNHELTYPNGGLSRLYYENGVITERRSWVVGSHKNCSGDISHWGTILSCEEFPPPGSETLGFVIEVYPSQPDTWVRRPALGRCSHEDLIEDPLTGSVYMTDDSETGVFFKFEPQYMGYMGIGALFAFNEPDGEWIRITDLLQAEEQALNLGATAYPRPEGLVYNPIDDAIYIAVTGVFEDPETRYGYILRFDPRTQTMTRWLDGDGDVLANPDNLEVDICGNLLVQEDMYVEHTAGFGPNEVLLIAADRTITPILRGLDPDPDGEPSGLVLDPNQRRFWVNWMSGSESEFIEVRLPAGWNCPGIAVPEPAPPYDGFGLIASPNPFAMTTWLQGRVAAGERARLDIYDARGEYWRTLVDGEVEGGEIGVAWDGSGHRGRRAPRGYYFARLRAGERSTAVRILLLR